jgi:hypothetical protein
MTDKKRDPSQQWAIRLERVRRYRERSNPNGMTRPFPSLERLDVATAMPSAFRLGIGVVALPTRPTPLSDHPSRPNPWVAALRNETIHRNATGTTSSPSIPEKSSGLHV